MPSTKSSSSQDLIFINQESLRSRRQARSHLARAGIRARIRRQNHQIEDSRSDPTTQRRSLSPQDLPDGLKSAFKSPKPSGLELPARISPSGYSLVEYLISTHVYRDLASTWGVSPAICPGPTHLTHCLSRASPVLDAIFRASVAFHCIDLNIWSTQDQKRNLQVAALTYRGEAIASARRELLGWIQCGSTDHEGTGHASIREDSAADWEASFSIVLRLLQLDYRFARSSVYSHFAACRRLLRGSLGDLRADRRSIGTLASTIRNPSLHHIMIAFEFAQSTAESLVWSDRDLDFLQPCLQGFVHRVSRPSATKDHSDPQSSPRLPPSTILWRCLAKEPGTVASNIYGDVSEASVQLGSIMVLCSVFLDYEGSCDNPPSIPQQCVDELENALFSLGESEAVSSALNVSWLLGGGLGLPIHRRRERLWLVSGFVYALKRGGCFNDATSEVDLNADAVKEKCLNFLNNRIGTGR